MQQSSFVAIIMCLLCTGAASGKELVLEASKDTFVRSNQQIRNNGGNKQLMFASAPMVRSLIAFDLSVVTNRIESAQLRFRLDGEQFPAPATLVIAPMVQTENNANWGEGTGNLGANGQNARPGDANFLRSAYPDTPWESARGSELPSIGSSSLWKPPVARLVRLKFGKERWVEVALDDAGWLEAIRNSDIQTVTLGLWGTAGNGFYMISSKESGHAPQLMLTVPDDKK